MPELEAGDGKPPIDIRGGLPMGTTLRGYELKSILGKGAFGITYRARDLTLDRDVAIKEYLPTALALREGRTTVLPISTDHAEQFAWGRERFMDEARTLAKLDRTPAIVRVFDFLEDNGTAYMVMALIEGETLNRRLMREKKLTPEAVERLLFPLLDGLEEVHGIGFLHRDIKPANIMIDGHGRPTLIDFGASRAAMAGRSTTMTAIFTPGYAASEQFTAAKLGPWSDIYGLAATLYHAITGRIPPSAIDRILNDTYEPLTTLQPEGFPPGLLAGIDAGLAIRVEDRPATVAEWRQMLRSDGYGAAALEATRVAHKPNRPARATGGSKGAWLRAPALWGSIAAAIVLLAGGGYLAVTSLSPGGGPSIASLSAEQLEQALVERRKADALASEKRRLEEEARQKADAEAETKRQADSELEQARQARLNAEQELAELKASIEARRQAEPSARDQEAVAAQRSFEEAAQRKAEQEASALREAEEEAASKAAADAEAKRQADQALAEAEAQRKRAEEAAKAKADAETAARAQASAEAQRKAEQDSAARRQADEAEARAQAEREKAEAEARIKADAKTEADKAAAALAKLKDEDETAEKALRLEPADRQRLQVALSSLGFDTRGIDGLFGPRTRDMIAAWQKARNQPPTGFLTAAQQQTLTKEAAATLTKYDEQKKAEEEAKGRPVTAAPSSASTTAAFPDGTYIGSVVAELGVGAAWTVTVRLTISNGRGSGTIGVRGCGLSPFSVSISSRGELSGQGDLKCAIAGSRQATSRMSGDFTLSGIHDGKTVDLIVHTARDTLRVPLSLSTGAAPTASAASALPNGTYAGALQLSNWVMHISVQFTNGVGSGTVTRSDCAPARISLRVDSTGNVTGDGHLFGATSRCEVESMPITGRIEDSRLLLGVTTSWGGGGMIRREFVLSQGGRDTTESTASNAPAAPIRTSATLALTDSSLRSCRFAGRFEALTRFDLTIHSNKVEAQMPWGSEMFAVGADGAFSGIVTGPLGLRLQNTDGPTRLSVRGNVKSKEVRLDVVGPTGAAWCTLVGAIS